MIVLTAFENDTIHASDLRLKGQFSSLLRFALSSSGEKILHARHNAVKLRNWCGIIPFSSNGILEILPKTGTGSDTTASRKLLFSMLKRIGRFETFRFSGIGKLNSQGNSLFEIFITCYLTELAKLLGRGISSDYISREDNLQYIKGKIQINKNIRQNQNLKNRTVLLYDEYERNIPENRIIKTCLLFLVKKSRNYENQRRLKEFILKFSEVEVSHSLEGDRSRIHYHRMNDYYEPVIRWSVAFLNLKSPAPSLGKDSLPSLVFPMERVFEAFVTRVLKEKREPEGWRVKAQSSKYYLLKDSNKDLFQLRPDILCEKDDTLIIGDAKWKILDQDNCDEKYNISQSDLYQLLSYVSIYRAQGYRNISVEIYYPEHDLFQEPLRFTYSDEYKTKISIRPIRLY
jgi:5-methylcytosine-specific restriction enzyme subunit McrC